MHAKTSTFNSGQVSLRTVDQDNWRNVANLKVSEAQRDFVAEPCRYLALCAYGRIGSPWRFAWMSR